MSLEEVLDANCYLDYITASKLLSWINNVVLPKESDGLIEEIVVKTLKKKEDTYNPKKGGLLSYLKTSIKLDVLNTKTAPTIDYYSLKYDMDLASIDVDMGVFSDQEINSMYKVSQGKGSPKDIEIVKGLINE
jgi:hypothetical protein